MNDDKVSIYIGMDHAQLASLTAMLSDELCRLRENMASDIDVRERKQKAYLDGYEQAQNFEIHGSYTCPYDPPSVEYDEWWRGVGDGRKFF